MLGHQLLIRNDYFYKISYKGGNNNPLNYSVHTQEHTSKHQSPSPSKITSVDLYSIPIWTFITKQSLRWQINFHSTWTSQKALNNSSISIHHSKKTYLIFSNLTVQCENTFDLDLLSVGYCSINQGISKL